MLSDEEKKAIERIDYIQDFIIENGQYNADVNDMQYFSKVLNLIEKHSKEIEELNKENTRQHKLIGNIHKKWEDKIKAKIEEVDLKMVAHQDVREAVKQTLQSLLEKE